MLENFLRPKIDEYGEERNLEDFWFHQDGATAHTARRPRAILKEMFPGRVVSLHEAVPWPPRSPDLSPCDFFL
jgi:transposase